MLNPLTFNVEDWKAFGKGFMYVIVAFTILTVAILIGVFLGVHSPLLCMIYLLCCIGAIVGLCNVADSRIRRELAFGTKQPAK